MLIKPASKKKFYLPSVAPFYKAAGGGGSPAYVFRDMQTALDDGSHTFIDWSVDIGTASSDRVVVVGFADLVSASSSVIVNSVTLTEDVEHTGATIYAAVHSGLVTAGSGVVTIRTNFTQTSVGHSLAVWTLTGLSSNVVKQTANAVGNPVTTTINVTAGDFLFAIVGGNNTNSGDFSGSTQSPAATRSVLNTFRYYSGDWTIASTNASFSIATSIDSDTIAAATYR